MQISIEQRQDNGAMYVSAVISREFIHDECEASPFAHLMTPDQQTGILEDTILMVLGLQRTEKRSETNENA